MHGLLPVFLVLIEWTGSNIDDSSEHLSFNKKLCCMMCCFATCTHFFFSLKLCVIKISWAYMLGCVH